jgi:hypothetical protein
MGLRAEQVERNAAKAVKRAAVAADTYAVLATPVDTGRARANWITSIGAPKTETTDEVDKEGGPTISAHQRTINRWNIGAGTIYITNSLPYIIPLDEGSSKKRPEGMSKGAIQAAQEQLKNARLIK